MDKVSVFLSYAREDLQEAKRLCAELEDAGIYVWFDEKDLLPGSRWEYEIEKAIRTGLLFTAGLVAGEALMGVVIAILVVLGIELFVFGYAPWWPGLIIWSYIAALLAYIPIREIIKRNKQNNNL